MSKLGLTILLLLLLLIITGLVFLVKNYDTLMVSPSPSPTPSETVRVSPTPVPVGALIKVNQPELNMVWDPSKAVEISGQARGNWYFEASFPLRVIDSYGNELAVEPIQALGEWMTTDFVPFQQTVKLKSPLGLTGQAIFMNANPSGEAEHARQLSVPVKFALPTTTTKVFFSDTKKDPNMEKCEQVYPVTRTVARTNEPIRVALSELLLGLTEAEKTAGLITSLNSGVKLNGLKLANGVLTIDFGEELQTAVGGACRVTAIRAQIIETAKQFSSVKQVIISVNGRSEDILQP